MSTGAVRVETDVFRALVEDRRDAIADVSLSVPAMLSLDRLKVPNYGGVGGLGTGPCRAVGADPPCDTELGGDLACRRLGSQGKYVERVYARDPGQAGR